MARIPQVQIGGGGDARAGIVNPTVGIPATDLSGPIDLLEGFRKWAKQDELAKDNIVSVQRQEQYKRQSLEAVSQLNPMDEDYSEKVRSALSEVQQNVLTDTGITSREVSEDLNFRLTAAMEGDVTTATVTRRTALAQTAIQTSDDLANVTLDQIRSNPDNADQYLAEFAGQSARLNSAIPPLKVQERAIAFGNAALAAHVEGLAQAGRIDEAKSLLSQEGDQLDPEANRTLGRRIREIQNTALADSRSAFNRERAALEIAIIDATTGAQLTALRAQVEKLDAAGELPGSLQGTKVQLIRAIEAKQTSLAKDGKKLNEALTARSNGTLHKPEEVDLAYEHEFEQMAAENDGRPSPDVVLDHLAGFVSQTGRMPSRQKAFIENAEVTTDAQQLSAAALMDQRINETAPTAQTGAGPRVELTRALMEHAGMDASSAAQRVIAQVPDRATADARAKTFKEDIFPDFVAADFMNEEVFGRGFFERNTPFGRSEIEVPAGVAREAEETFSTFYRLMGDEGPARVAAANAMQRKYGTTQVGRDNAVATAYPIERHYFPGELARLAASQPELQSRIITADVEDSLGQVIGFRDVANDPESPSASLLALNIPDAPPGLEGAPPYALVSDAQTERALAAGGQGSWEVRVRDDYGNLVPLRVTTAQGSVNLRIVAPTDAEVRAMPAWQEHIKTEEDSVRFRRELREEGRFGGQEFGGQEFGGQEFGGQRFGGQRFGGQKFGGNRFKNQQLVADQILGDTSEPARQAIPIEAAQEPDEIVSEVSRNTAPPAPTKIPRGIRNMNPGNIERNKITWEGMAEDQKGDDRFVVFSEPKYGIRAMARVLQTYQDKHGLNTVQGIISRWAPAKENQTKSYVDAVAKRLGVRREQQVDLSDDGIMRGLVAAIIQHENGVQPYADSVLDEAIALAR